MKELKNIADLTDSIESGITLVDVYADWCGPCKTLMPVLTEMSNEIENVEFVKANADEASDIAQSLGIRGLPTLVVFKAGVEVRRITGAKPKAELVRILEEVAE